MSEISPAPAKPSETPTVGLFVTCLADLMRPSVGFAAARLLTRAGCAVVVPEAQTCCGQPALNSGDAADAAAIARATIAAFEGFDFVVAPSGSCAATIKVHYPELLAADAAWAARAEALAAKTHELFQFLVTIRGVTDFGAAYGGTVTYHDSCSGLRELGISAEPRALMAGVSGLALTELAEPGVCCGFGGLFSVKYPDISGRIVDDKADAILATGADTLLGGDLGCLMNMAGRLRRRGAKVAVRHLAEVVAGMTAAAPPIAAAPEDGNGER